MSSIVQTTLGVIMTSQNYKQYLYRAVWFVVKLVNLATYQSLILESWCKRWTVYTQICKHPPRRYPFWWEGGLTFCKECIQHILSFTNSLNWIYFIVHEFITWLCWSATWTTSFIECSPLMADNISLSAYSKSNRQNQDVNIPNYNKTKRLGRNQ